MLIGHAGTLGAGGNHLLILADKRRPKGHTPSMEEFGLLMLLGVRVREVRNLEEGHIWLPRRRLLLVDSELGSAEREELTSWLISAAAESG